MKYGHFDDSLKEYVIDTPFTPLPWINYLGNESLFGLVSNTAGGYTFYKDAKLRRLTRFRYNNVPRDAGGRCYYINDSGTIWSPSYLPAKTALDSYKCRHGLGYSVIEGEKNDVCASLTMFIPLNTDAEVHILKIYNKSNSNKHLIIHSFAEWCLWNAVDDSTNFQRNYNTGEVEVEGSAIYHKTEYRERRNHYAFYWVNRPISGFDTDRDTFLGQFNDFSAPQQVTLGQSGNSVASGWSPVASHRIELDLAAGEESETVFLLGYAENPPAEKFIRKNILNKSKAYTLMQRFADSKAAHAALSELKAYWDSLLSKLTVTTGIDKVDRSVNIWNQYQCMVTFNMSRSASYFESGTGRGMGFRDSCQDLLGFVHLIPERSRERIIDIASIQFEDGSTYHQYQPLTKRGNADVGSGFNDDPLWLVACTSAYIKETGDYGILDTPVPFNNVEGSEKPLMEHLRRSVFYTMTHLGPHGLPLIGRADWNDCLNLNCFSDTPGESFQTTANFESGVAESVFIAGMFVKYAAEYAEICAHTGNKIESENVFKAVREMEKAVIEHGWDGKWYLRAYDAFGKKIGSHECAEGQIFIEPQGFCGMAGIGGSLGYPRTALESTYKLLANDYGVELLAPCYTEYRLELGEISSYPPGYKENGSVFCHNNPWIMLAFAKTGDGNRAFELYKKTCPAYIEDISEIHKTEPYVYSQTVAGREAANYGLAKNSWLTGTASWMMVAISQGILGIKPAFDGLEIAPALPDEIKSYRATRVFRGVTYSIEVEKKGLKSPILEVNGKLIVGSTVPLPAGLAPVSVKYTY